MVRSAWRHRTSLVAAGQARDLRAAAGTPDLDEAAVQRVNDGVRGRVDGLVPRVASGA